MPLRKLTIIWCPFSRSLCGPQWIWNRGSASVSLDLIRQLHDPVLSLLSLPAEARVELLRVLCTVQENQRLLLLQVSWQHNTLLHALCATFYRQHCAPQHMRRYLVYSEADFEVFRPTGDTLHRWRWNLAWRRGPKVPSSMPNFTIWCHKTQLSAFSLWVCVPTTAD